MRRRAPADHHCLQKGDQARGWWNVLVVEPPHPLELEDGFADAEGIPNPDLPVTHTRVDITAVDAGTRMSITTTFPSPEAMEHLVSWAWKRAYPRR